MHRIGKLYVGVFRNIDMETVVKIDMNIDMSDK